MAELKASSVKGFLAKPERYRIYLFYGDDQGSISERARQLALSLTNNKRESIITFSDAQLNTDPQSVLQEALSLNFFSESIAIICHSAPRGLLPVCEQILDEQVQGNPVLIEAYEMKKDAALIKKLKAHPQAVIIPCYQDTAKDVLEMIDHLTQEAALKIAPDIKQRLATRLGHNRLLTRRELEKLTLYAHGKTQISWEDVTACIIDVAEHGLEDMSDALFLGERQKMLHELDSLFREGQDVQALIITLTRQADRLAKWALEVQEGKRALNENGFQDIFWSRRENTIRAVRNMTKLTPVTKPLDAFSETILMSRKHPDLAKEIVTRACLKVCGWMAPSSRATAS